MSDRLSEIKERLAKATPGEWVARGYHVYGPKHPESNHPCGRVFLATVAQGSNRRDPELDGGWAGAMPGDGRQDAEFIAAAPADIAWLVGELEKYGKLVALAYPFVLVAANEHRASWHLPDIVPIHQQILDAMRPVFEQYNPLLEGDND